MRRSLFRHGVIAIAGLLGTPAFGAELYDPERPPNRNQTAGPAVQLETGRYDSGYGLAVLYYQPLPVPRLTVGAEAGAGFTGTDAPSVAGRAHLFVAYGHMHRVMLAAGWTVLDRDMLRLHGTTALEQSFWGPEGTLGYELVASSGAIVRAWAGLGMLRRPRDTGVDRWRWGLGVALGWKLW